MNRFKIHDTGMAQNCVVSINYPSGGGITPAQSKAIFGGTSAVKHCKTPDLRPVGGVCSVGGSRSRVEWCNDCDKTTFSNND